MTLQSWRERLSLVLLALLPFHALLVTVGTKVLVGPGQSPLTVLALWKEVVLGVVLLMALLEWIRKPRWQFDIIDGLIAALVVLSVLVTAMTHGDWQLYAFGFKYDFVPLVTFMALRRVPWSDDFGGRALTVVLRSAAAVAVYAIASLLLPSRWFTWLGYSDLHSLYTPDGPLAAYQQIEGVPLRRAQSTMSGPNQLGLWLLLPLATSLLQRQWLIGAFVAVALLLSMSRAAALAAVVMVAIIVWQRCPRTQRLQWAVATAIIGLLAGIGLLQLAPHLIMRAASTGGHIERPMAALRTMVEHPLGLGLGMAGPASNRVSDTCVQLPAGSDASWAADRPNLCVFVGSTQVQPQMPCSCPRLPENWYLQIGVEMGVIGFVVFMSLIAVMLLRLLRFPEILLPFVGVSLAALVLHAWEAPAVAYTLWLLAATVLPPGRRT